MSVTTQILLLVVWIVVIVASLINLSRVSHMIRDITYMQKITDKAQGRAIKDLLSVQRFTKEMDALRLEAIKSLTTDLRSRPTHGPETEQHPEFGPKEGTLPWTPEVQLKGLPPSPGGQAGQYGRVYGFSGGSKEMG